MMRALLLALSAGLLALSGCTEIAYPAMEPQHDDGQATNNTVEVVAVQESIGEDGNATGASYPHITSIVTAPYTAPVEIALGRAAGEHVRLALIAGPEGLRCEAAPTHTTSVPAGFKEVRTWTACELRADGEVFTSARTEGTTASLPMMDEVPVDRFTWNMTVHRLLVNNTGEHEEVLAAVESESLAAPDVHTGHTIRQDDWLVQSSPYTICDTFTADGFAEARFIAHAERGRALLSVDLGALDIYEVSGPGPQVDPANASLDAGPMWWIDDGAVHAVGAWGERSEVQINATIHFRGDGSQLAVIPPPECPDALFVDWQEIPLAASATGIAAGWAAVDDGVLPVEVWHTY